MGYRQHWRAADAVAVQIGTTEEIAQAIGGVEEDTDDAVHLVLNDERNQEAFVLTGDPDTLIDLASGILTQALAIKYPDADHQVRLHLGDRAEMTFYVPDEWTLMLDADGRRYAGVMMPSDDLEFSVVTWDGDPNENTTFYPRGNKVDGEGREFFEGDEESLYRKCAHCQLFVEEQDPEDVAQARLDGVPIAPYVHNHRGDEPDERLDESHEAEPEPGPGAPLTWWKAWGPPAMRARFIDDETVDVLGDPLPRGRCDTCGAPCDAITGKCMREPEKHDLVGGK